MVRKSTFKKVSSKQPSLQDIVEYLNGILEISKFKDAAHNGLQVQGPDSQDTPIKRIALAVDAGLAVLQSAVNAKADLLIVHHGMIWGNSPSPISGTMHSKICTLIRNKCSLYASHLPLDAHPKLGNAIELGRFFGLKKCTPFGKYQGVCVGVAGALEKPMTLDHLAQRAKQLVGGLSIPLSIKSGPERIQHVGIVTGSASFSLNEAAEKGLDLLITGEPKQEAFHLAHELGVNALFAGHYATETFGVRALGDHLSRRFHLESIFLDHPTGI